MMRRLSLKASREEPFTEDCEISSPSIRNRADSLVFSVTSQKYFSPKDTMLMESKQHQVSKDLQTLQLKLQNLQSRVERIDSQNGTEVVQFSKEHPQHYPPNLFIQMSKGPIIDFNSENNGAYSNKVGKIVKRQKELSRTHKLLGKQKRRKTRIDTINTHNSRQSRNSLISEDTELFVKMKELSQLKKEVGVMKNSMERSQRSKSIASERLSASKNVIKSLKKEQKRQHRIIEQLRNDLKKSQTIRDKQRVVMVKQQNELNYYREQFKSQKIR